MVEKDNNLEQHPQVDVLLIPMSEDETSQLLALKELIQKNNLEYNSKIVDDNYLIRFLRARKLDLMKTFDMFKKYVEWRKAEDIDNISSFEYKEEYELLSCYPKAFHKTDKFGRPIHYELLGLLDLPKIQKITSFERMLKYNIKKVDYMVNHILPICSKAHGANVSQFINIIDMKNFTYRNISKKAYNYISSDSSNMQNYFPELLGNLYVLNTGIIFNTVWAIIKTFLDERTKKKILFPGKDYLKDLLQIVYF